MLEPTHYFVQIPADSLDRLAYDVTFGWKVREAVRDMREAKRVFGAVKVGVLDPSDASVTAVTGGEQVLDVRRTYDGGQINLSVELNVAAPTTVRFLESSPKLLMPADIFIGKCTVTETTDL